MSEHDDDELDDETEEEFEVYEVDEETRSLIEVACNCMVSLSEAQIQPEAAQQLMALADALAERFAIHALELEEHHHQTEEGEEVLLAPKGGVFPDSPEGEAAVEPE